MQKHDHDVHGAASGPFSTETTGLPDAMPSRLVTLADGDEFNLKIAAVSKHLGDTTVRMLAYNGSVPGPTLQVRQGSRAVIHVTNEADLPATVHWHGLRVENAYDGTHQTQAPIPVGGTFSYHLRFPDPGLYWYHPHIREDYGQEMGLYANIVVVPAEADYWPPVHREVFLTLDDVLIEGGKIGAFDRGETNYAAMGRFGNTMLVGGEPSRSLSAQPGEVIRFHFTNTANTRVFNLAIPGARMKRVGGDSGRYEREEFVESVILAPSERAIIDVLFEQAGERTLEHRTPKRVYALAAIDVGGAPATPSLAQSFAALRHNQEWVAERERLARYVQAPPDKTLAIVAEMNMEAPAGAVKYACPMHPDVVSDQPAKCPKCHMKLVAVAAAGTQYVCPMHPDVTRDKPGRCPKCWMKLMAVAAAPTQYVCPMHPDVTRDKPGRCPKCWMKLMPAASVPKQAEGHEKAHHGHAEHAHGDAGGSAEHSHVPSAEAEGIEWEDDMVDVNRITTPANMHWRFIDRETGAVNGAIQWKFRVGDQVKLRLVNEMESDHPMHHPFHVHGAGRFVVLARRGVPEPNLVWKDTVLLRTGETVDILLDVTNPGVWMAHCHIAEHHESGMMFSFDVVPAEDAGPNAN